jgi:hypothetical protein
MKTVTPNMSKYEGPLTVCNCTDTNIRKEQRKCLTYREGKKGIVHIIDLQAVLARITMDIFQTSSIDNNLTSTNVETFLAPFMVISIDVESQNGKKIKIFNSHLYRRIEVIVYYVSKTCT